MNSVIERFLMTPTYIADGISNQPPSAITSANGTTVAKYCYSDNKFPTQSGGPEDTTFVYWWVHLGVALLKSFDTYLKFDSIKDSCLHFTGSWKNGVSCIWDVGATMIAWAGAIKKCGNRIQKYHAYVHSNPFVEYPLAEISKRDDYYVNMMMEDVDEFTSNIGHVAHEVETLKFHTGTRAVSTKEGSEKRDDLKYIEAIRLLTADKDGNKHHFIIGDNGGATYFQWSPRSSETYFKRTDGRFEDEKFNGAGMEANVCRAEEDSDSGHINLDGDYVTWRDDLKCHDYICRIQVFMHKVMTKTIKVLCFLYQ